MLLAALAWVGLLLFQGTLLTFFGADESLLPLAEIYMKPIRYVLPLFLFNQLLAAFLRNDGAPGLATLGVLAGGVLILILPSLLGAESLWLAMPIAEVLTALYAASAMGRYTRLLSR